MIAAVLGAWVAGARRYRWAVLALSVLLTALALWAVATRIGVSTDTSTMLDPDLPFQQENRALKAAFPQFGGELVIVIDAETATRADEAAQRLTEALQARDDLFAFVSDLAGHPFFRRNGLLFLSLDEVYALSDTLAEAQPFLGTLWRDPSLRGLAALMDDAADQITDGGLAGVALPLGPVLERMASVADAQAAGEGARLDWRAMIQDGEDAAGPARHLVLAKPKRQFGSMTPAGDAMRAIRATARDLGLTPESGVRVRLTGAAAMETEELASVQTGMDIAGAITFVAVVTLLILGLRSPRLILATVATLVAGLCWTAGLAALTVGTLNLISVAFAVLFIGLSVDFGIHFGLRFKESRDRGVEPGPALGDAARGVGPGLALCAVAAAIAFLSFLPTDYRGLAQLGLISGMGMGVAFLANLTLLPALLAVWPPRSRQSTGAGTDGAARLAGRLDAGLRRHARTVALGALALAVAAAALAPGARFDFDPLNLRDPETESVATLFDLLQDPRVTPYTMDILAPDLEAAEALAARVEALPEVSSAITARDLVPANQDDKLYAIQDMALYLGPALAQEPEPAPDADARRAARDRMVAALERIAAASGVDSATRTAAERLAGVLAGIEGPEALARVGAGLTGDLPPMLSRLRESLAAGPVTLEDLPEGLLGRYLAEDGRARVAVRPALDPRDPDDLARFVDAVRAEVPSATGSPVLIRESGRTVIRAFAEAAALALVGITVLLAVTLRRLRDILLVYAPLALAALLTVATAALFGLPFNFANVIVLPLLFGLGVASAIHLVHRERDEADVSQAMTSSTPRAVVFSALTTIGSFGSIAASSHPGTASMGVLLTIAIGLTLVCTLGVLPALLALWPSRRDGV
ncbi:MMPL family transporter [Roseospira navarrensis]|uniref:MMPL family transporter n=1 Tax=Roseospira navarrensis TaxID=140058 RepID=A0A7X2D217_9PROT|nr:MMPL family transporter [Roseospira navarrensis]MQX35288.1 MMPL family transporter [Roseospira navarrensis]